jgi:hypothetical protein
MEIPYRWGMVLNNGNRPEIEGAWGAVEAT